MPKAPASKQKRVCRIHPESKKETHTIMGMRIFKRGDVYEISDAQERVLEKQYNRHGDPTSGKIFQIGTQTDLETYDRLRIEQTSRKRGTVLKPIPLSAATPAPSPTDDGEDDDRRTQEPEKIGPPEKAAKTKRTPRTPR